MVVCCFSPAISTVIKCNWILKKWIFSWQSWIWTLFHPNYDDSKPLSLSMCGAAFDGNLAKLITLSIGLCTLCVIFILSSILHLFLFSLSGLKARLCAQLAHSLFIWTPCLATGVMEGSHRLCLCLSSTEFPGHSLPSACLQLNTPQGLGRLNYFGHKVTGNQWREVFFFSERGR